MGLPKHHAIIAYLVLFVQNEVDDFHLKIE